MDIKELTPEIINDIDNHKIKFEYKILTSINWGYKEMDTSSFAQGLKHYYGYDIKEYIKQFTPEQKKLWLAWNTLKPWMLRYLIRGLSYGLSIDLAFKYALVGTEIITNPEILKVINDYKKIRSNKK